MYCPSTLLYYCTVERQTYLHCSNTDILVLFKYKQGYFYYVTQYSILFLSGKTNLHPKDNHMVDRRNGSLSSCQRFTTKLYDSSDCSPLSDIQQNNNRLRLQTIQTKSIYVLRLCFVFYPHVRVFHRRVGRHNFPHQQLQTKPSTAGLHDWIREIILVQQGHQTYSNGYIHLRIVHR